MMSQTPYTMTSHRPYMLRALVEWINDNDMTPHILVDATLEGVDVPPSAVRDGQVILNIAERAVAGLHIDDFAVTFSARFGGVSRAVCVPIEAVLAVYARETGQGMALPDDIPGTGGASLPPQAPVVAEPETKGPRLAAVRDDEASGDDGNDTPPTPPAGGKRPFLRVVK